MSEAISAVVAEFKTLSPDITHTVVFRANGETLAKNDATTPEQTQTLTTQLKIISCAQCIGGIKTLVIRDVSAQLSINSVGDVYLATLSRRIADEKVVQSLTQVVVPTVIRLALGVSDCSLETQTDAPVKVDVDADCPVLPIQPLEPSDEAVPQKAQTAFQPNPTTQLMIEKLSGLLVASDTVRIDSEILSRWHEVSDGKQFSCVHLETLDGKSVTCKFKPQKETKAGSKGLIFVPEKIIQTLQSDKGKLVVVKPVLDEEAA